MAEPGTDHHMGRLPPAPHTRPGRGTGPYGTHPVPRQHHHGRHHHPARQRHLPARPVRQQPNRATETHHAAGTHRPGAARPALDRRRARPRGRNRPQNQRARLPAARPRQHRLPQATRALPRAIRPRQHARPVHRAPQTRRTVAGRGPVVRDPPARLGTHRGTLRGQQGKHHPAWRRHPERGGRGHGADGALRLGHPHQRNRHDPARPPWRRSR